MVVEEHSRRVELAPDPDERLRRRVPRKQLLAEFDYDLNLTPSVPLLNPTKPHRAYWYLKKYGLPFMYWNLMLKGLA
jgi:hypothetical protein